MKTFKILRRLNIIISITIGVLALYILLIPALPGIIFAINTNQYYGFAYKSQKTLEILREKANELPEIPKENTLVIPQIYVNAKINEGTQESTLNLGMWRRPNTSTPDKGGNTVITSHRFLHTIGPNTFFNLDRLEINNIVLVYWQGKEYVYKVYEISNVLPQQVDIEFNTKDPILTLYTCEPLWTSEKRLVVKAKLQ
ncbi:MAG: sortase [Candidatus Dojkabacteria bacterium]